VRKASSRAVGEWKKEHYARQYGDGKPTLSRAAQQAGISLWEMMDYARRRKIPAQYDPDDLQRDIGAIQRRMGGKPKEV
jgi:predicted HTH domain antitoxin